jgi:Tol biopolymer transport system component
MSLPPGTRLGSYEITTLLGIGGMGEVYGARDTKLGRDVAIKLLPSAFIDDADRRARFEREARLLASLQHPNIALVYGYEEAGDLCGLVMELVDGVTLAERLRRGPVPLAESLGIAGQLCNALKAAHTKQIIHRDLKPSNIKITPSGDVKVLDFGLAKIATSEGIAPHLAESPTVTSDATRAGVILGTVAYMSPEQARGLSVDRRTDIWAFGCVLYEMLTGRQAFGAATTTDTLARVIERDPDWSLLPRLTPAAMQRVLKRCLEKDVKHRPRDIGDVRGELDEVQRERVGAAVTAAASASKWRPRAWKIGLTLAVLSILLAAAIFVRPWQTAVAPPSPRVLRSAILLPEGQQLDRSAGNHAFALSADGSMLVYSALAPDKQLFVRDLTAFEPKPLPGTNGATQPFFSPDGRSIAFFADGWLQRVALGGGPALRICEVPIGPRGGSWGANDTIVFAMVQSGLWKVPVSGGKPQPIPNSERAVWPELLSSNRVLFTNGPEIATIALDGTHRVVHLTTGAVEPGVVVGQGGFNGARYVDPGFIVYGQGVSVLAVPFDPESRPVDALPVTVSESVFRGSGGGAVYFAVSGSGALAYALAGSFELVSVSRDGRAAPISSDRGVFRHPAVSPNGRQIAVAIESDSRRADLWVIDADPDRGTKTRLTTERHNIMPVWSPDGARVVANHFLEYRADGSSAKPRQLLQPDNWYPTSWSHDERHMLFNNLSQTATAGNGDIWVISDGTPRPLLTSKAAEYHGKFSPGAEWIAYQSNESGRYEVYILKFPELNRRVVVSPTGGTDPRWSRDGREIFYRQGTAVIAVGFDGRRGVLTGAPQKLFEGPFGGAGGELQFDVAADGRFVMTRGDDAAVGRQINIIMNWVEELKVKGR